MEYTLKCAIFNYYRKQPQQGRCPFLVAWFYLNGSVSSVGALTSSMYVYLRCHASFFKRHSQPPSLALN